MALIDNQNKVIYWDEVNWQWLPFVSISVVNSREGIIKFLFEEGYTLYSISNLGISEISLGCYLYNGKIYKKAEGRPLKNLTSLLCLISGKSSKTINKELKGMGLLSKENIDSLLSKRDTIEFDGKVYKHLSDLARDYEINPSYLSNRLSKGLTLNNIIPAYSRKRISDHLGNRYRILEDMLNYWGISFKAYKKRKERGWSLEKILTTPIKTTQTAHECDFDGKVFPSIILMAKEYGVSHTSILYHMKKGKTPAEALSYLLSNGRHARIVKDHLGNSFSSKVKMSEHWGVNYDTFRDRIKRGWSLEESLTGKRRER